MAAGAFLASHSQVINRRSFTFLVKPTSKSIFLNMGVKLLSFICLSHASLTAAIRIFVTYLREAFNKVIDVE
jgi:hypothetical protein